MKKLFSKVIGTVIVIGVMLSACGIIAPDETTILGQEEVIAGQEFRLVAVTPLTENQEIKSDSWTFYGNEYSGQSDKYNPEGEQFVAVNLVDLVAPEGEGPYTATYTLMLNSDDGTMSSEASHEVEVIVVDIGEIDDDDDNDDNDDEQQAQEASCPAAPAIATDYMREIGVQPGSDDWKTVVRSVAHETGSKGELWAANSCDPGYREAVIDYVNGKLAED